jgi:uncharacterized membrane protein YhaH (DUF805 family)
MGNRTGRMIRSRYFAPIGALVVAVVLAPFGDDPLQALRIVEVSLSALITVVLVNVAIGYVVRSRRAPGTTVLTGPEFLVLVFCLILLLAGATLTVVGRLLDANPQASPALILGVIVQPPLLWWAIRMEKRLAAGP